jgi:hypothetical protein
LLYALFGRVMALVLLRFRSSDFKELEIVVLRHVRDSRYSRRRHQPSPESASPSSARLRPSRPLSASRRSPRASLRRRDPRLPRDGRVPGRGAGGLTSRPGCPGRATAVDDCGAPARGRGRGRADLAGPGGGFVDHRRGSMSAAGGSSTARPGPASGGRGDSPGQLLAAGVSCHALSLRFAGLSSLRTLHAMPCAWRARRVMMAASSDRPGFFGVPSGASSGRSFNRSMEERAADEQSGLAVRGSRRVSECRVAGR